MWYTAAMALIGGRGFRQRKIDSGWLTGRDFEPVNLGYFDLSRPGSLNINDFPAIRWSNFPGPGKYDVWLWCRAEQRYILCPVTVV